MREGYEGIWIALGMVATLMVIIVVLKLIFG